MVGRPVDRASRERSRLRFVNRAGEERHLGLASSILRDVDGSEAGHVVIFQDVTEVVAMERDLRRSERLAGVGQLAADIAHEVRNPLAAISGSIEILRAGLGRGEADQERRRLMGIVLREIGRLNDLITDFLQYARPSPAKREPQPLAPLVEELCRMAEGARPEGVRFETDVGAETVVIGDADQLRQMLWNLVGNAFQAVGPQGRVRVAARRRSPAQGPAGEGRNGPEEASAVVELLVEDDGCGMSSDQMERIFDPFFTTKRSGTGLGLATVHRIVEGHGGSIRVESEPGAGARFRIDLPSAEEPS
jgi:two-component system sensor histidine kinase PilS (NtrC family)